MNGTDSNTINSPHYFISICLIYQSIGVATDYYISTNQQSTTAPPIIYHRGSFASFCLYCVCIVSCKMAVSPLLLCLLCLFVSSTFIASLPIGMVLISMNYSDIAFFCLDNSSGVSSGSSGQGSGISGGGSGSSGDGSGSSGDGSGDINCTELPNGNYAVACSHEFISCSNGKASVMHCQHQLIYDPDTNECSHLSSVRGCNNQISAMSLSLGM